MSKKYPKVHLEALLYPRDIPGVHINWDFDANPFFPEREYHRIFWSQNQSDEWSHRTYWRRSRPSYRKCGYICRPY